MRICFGALPLLSTLLFACGGDLAPVEASPTEPSAQERQSRVDASPSKTLSTCPKTFETYVEGPTAPTDACEVESFDANGKRVRIDRQSLVTAGATTTWVYHSYDSQGNLQRVFSRRSGVYGIESERMERRWIPKNGVVPVGYMSEPAWYEANYFYDALGQNVRETRDDGVDGILDGDTRRVFHANGQLAEEWSVVQTSPWVFVAGPLLHSYFNERGQLISVFEDGKQVRRLGYNATGLLSTEELLADGLVTSRTEWTHQDATHPLSRAHYYGTPFTARDGDRYRYTPNGKLASFETFAGLWKESTTYDDQGRKVRIEQTSGGETCVTLSSYAGDRVSGQNVTCNGKFRSELTSTETANLRVIHQREILGSKTYTAQTEETLNTCGAVTRRTRTTGEGSDTQEWDWSPTGKLLENRSIYNGTTTTARYTYDAKDHLTTAGGNTWTYDLAGRVTSHTFATEQTQSSFDSDSATTPWDLSEHVKRIEYRYICTPQ